MRKEKKYHFIYKTTNLLSGRYYIGMHSSDSLTDDYLGSGKYLRRAINKHGKENFEREILEFCKTREELKTRENIIVDLSEVAKKECMNLRTGGSGPKTNFGYTITPEIRKKLSENNAKYWLGKQRTDVTKRKISEAHMGKKLSDTHKLNVSKSLKGKYTGELNSMYGKSGELNPFYGKLHTEETKKIIREKRKLQIFTEETRLKLSNLRKKQINQLTINDVLVKTWDSVNLASITLNINKSRISRCGNNHIETAGGFKWSYTNI